MIKKYEELINEIALKFTKQFYREQFEEEADKDDYRIIGNADIWFWPVVIQEEYYFKLNEIITLFNNNWHTNIIKDYYDLCLEKYENMEAPWISFYNYGRNKTISAEILEKESKEELKTCEENVKKAEKIFLDSIKK